MQRHDPAGKDSRGKPLRVEVTLVAPNDARLMVDGADSVPPARSLNEQIRRLARMLAGGGADHLYAFTCECGCGAIVSLSAAQYDSEGGCWASGHRQPARRLGGGLRQMSNETL